MYLPIAFLVIIAGEDIFWVLFVFLAPSIVPGLH